MTCYQITRRSHYVFINVANRSFESMAEFEYLGKTVTYQNVIYDKTEKIEVGLHLLPCSLEYFVFQSAI